MFNLLIAFIVDSFEKIDELREQIFNYEVCKLLRDIDI